MPLWASENPLNPTGAHLQSDLEGPSGSFPCGFRTHELWNLWVLKPNETPPVYLSEKRLYTTRWKVNPVSVLHGTNISCWTKLLAFCFIFICQSQDSQLFFLFIPMYVAFLAALVVTWSHSVRFGQEPDCVGFSILCFINALPFQMFWVCMYMVAN